MLCYNCYSSEEIRNHVTCHVTYYVACYVTCQIKCYVNLYTAYLNLYTIILTKLADTRDWFQPMRGDIGSQYLSKSDNRLTYFINEILKHCNDEKL